MAVESSSPKWGKERDKAVYDTSQDKERHKLLTLLPAPKNSAEGIQKLLDKATKLIEKGDKDGAIKNLTDAFKHLDDNNKYIKSVVATRIGDIYREKGDATGDKKMYGRSQDYYEEALNLDVTNHEAFNGFGVVTYQIGEFGAANKAFVSAERLISERIETLSSKGEIDDPAKRELERLLTDRRSYQNNLSASAYMNKQYGTAQYQMLKALEPAAAGGVSSACENGVIHYNAGVVLPTKRQTHWDSANALKDTQATVQSHGKVLEIPEATNVSTGEKIVGAGGEIAFAKFDSAAKPIVDSAVQAAETRRISNDAQPVRDFYAYLSMLALTKAMADDEFWKRRIEEDHTPNKSGSLSRLEGFNRIVAKPELSDSAFARFMGKSDAEIVEEGARLEEQLGVQQPVVGEWAKALGIGKAEEKAPETAPAKTQVKASAVKGTKVAASPVAKPAQAQKKAERRLKLDDLQARQMEYNEGGLWFDKGAGLETEPVEQVGDIEKAIPLLKKTFHTISKDGEEVLELSSDDGRLLIVRGKERVQAFRP